MRTIDIYLDRDGTIIYDKHYLHDPDQVELLPGAARGLARLCKRQARLFVVTNQSGIGRGYFSHEQYAQCHNRLKELLSAEAVLLTDAACCPHLPDHSCDCRKPGIGMFSALQKQHNSNPRRCVMVGDKEADVMFGRNAGFGTVVLVLTGKGMQEAQALGLPEPAPGTDRFVPSQEQLAQHPDWPDLVAADLGVACDWLIDRM